MSIVCDTHSHLILEAHPSRGPCPDVAEFKTPLKRASQHVLIEAIVADAGYDSESNHRFAREELSVRSIIPANAGRPTKKPASGKYRRQMQTSFDKQKYGQRWQCETVISMIKRRQAVATSGRSYWSQRRDLMLMALTHNIMILLCSNSLFYRADLSPFPAYWDSLGNVTVWFRVFPKTHLAMGMELSDSGTCTVTETSRVEGVITVGSTTTEAL